MAAGVALSLATIAIDKAFDYRLVPQSISGGPDAAMEILGTVAASMVSLAALVLTITMVVVQLAMGQFSPRIVQRILEDKPSQLAIGIFVGTFGPDVRRALAAVDPDHASRYLLFTGPVHDVDVLASLFAFGDVTAIPSHSDSFPVVGLESYRMGTPCVVTEGTGAGEAYLDNPRRHGVEMPITAPGIRIGATISP